VATAAPSSAARPQAVTYTAARRSARPAGGCWGHERDREELADRPRAAAGRAPRRPGDPATPESAEHIIEFPGGAIQVARTSDGEYWAHIIVNRGFDGADGGGRESARGEVVDARIDSAVGVRDVPNTGTLTQIAVRVRPVKKV
jgi:hypothetical protein